jgi:hypothetical protein
MYFDPIYMILTVVTMGVSHFVSNMLQKRFSEFSQVPLPYSGAEIAQKMLRDYNVAEVNVTAVGGQLTDHYNPANKSVNLSEVVYGANNVAAAAVAAHECGHAVQHKTSYPFLQLRSRIVPLVQISSNFMQWVLLAGIIMAASGNTTVLLVGIAMFALTTLFSIITLPVEFNASARALKWMEQSGITQGESHEKAKKALFWAAMTYTVAALGSIGQLLYYVSMYMNSNRNS